MNRNFGAWLAMPVIVYLTVLFLVPCSIVLGYSLLARDFHGGVEWAFSWDAWRQATDGITLRVLARTLCVACGVTFVTALFAYPCAAVLARLPAGRRQMLVVLVSFPLITSLLLRTYGWMHLLPASLRGNVWGVWIVLAFNYLPFMILPLLKAYERADTLLVQAALDLGATPWQAFWRITWPLTRPGLAAGAALVFIPVMGEYLAPTFIGNGQVELIGMVVFNQFEQRNWPYAAACAVWLAATVIAPLLLALAWRSRRGEVRA